MPWTQLRAAIYFPLRTLSPFQRTVLLRCRLYQLRPPSHHLARLIPHRSTRLTLSYPAGKPKHRSNLVLAENGLISASGDQEEGEECKHVCAIGRAAWLSLSPTAFFFFLFFSCLVATDGGEIKWNQSPYYSFPLAGLNWSAFHGLENTVKTLWIPCDAVWQAAIAGVSWQAQRGSFSADAQANQNRIMFEHLFPLGRGEGAPASFNQDLKTGEPLIKRAALYIYLVPLEALLAYVICFDPAFFFFLWARCRTSLCCW